MEPGTQQTAGGADYRDDHRDDHGDDHRDDHRSTGRDLSPDEQRVLGCLIEKEATTPDNYPLTLNALRTACNQSTSRDPVVDYDDRTVTTALAGLRERGLTRTVHSTSNRAAKYRHVAGEYYDLDPGATALVAVLLLRGPQTVGELKSRTERQHRFESTDAVADTLAALAHREPPLVQHLERRPGQKDRRWCHLLGGAADEPTVSTVSTGPGSDETAATTTRDASVRDVTDDSDPYGAVTAEFYDLLATGMWDDFGLRLLELLDGVDVTAGPVVDVGSGSGAGLAFLTAAAPGAGVVAIEPSRAMRAALHARLALDDALRVAVTVTPARFADAVLPARASAVVVAAALGHLDGGERERLWRYVAEQLPAGAPAVVGVLPPFRPERIEPVRYRSVRVGGHVYEGWQEGEPVDDRTMRWTMTYRVLDADDPERVVAEHAARSRWHCDGPDDVAGEAAAFGLTVTPDEGCVVVRRDG